MFRTHKMSEPSFVQLDGKVALVFDEMPAFVFATDGSRSFSFDNGHPLVYNKIAITSSVENGAEYSLLDVPVFPNGGNI